MLSVGEEPDNNWDFTISRLTYWMRSAYVIKTELNTKLIFTDLDDNRVSINGLDNVSITVSWNSDGQNIHMWKPHQTQIWHVKTSEYPSNKQQSSLLLNSWWFQDWPIGWDLPMSLRLSLTPSWFLQIWKTIESVSMGWIMSPLHQCGEERTFGY
jgi:hypothetical protein